MQLRNTPERYGSVAQALHWSVALLVLFAWLSGFFRDELAKGTIRTTDLLVHISLGSALLLFVAVRLFWRAIDPPAPVASVGLAKWGSAAARLVHYGLYALLIVIPLLGIAVQFTGGHALPVFGLFAIPSPWQGNHDLSHNLKEIHELLANLMMVVFGLHATAALFHHWVLRDRTLIRMLPRFGSRGVSGVYAPEGSPAAGRAL